TIAHSDNTLLRPLLNSLNTFTHAGILSSLRCVEGVYELTRPASLVTVADVIRGVEGPFSAGGGAVAPPAPSGGAGGRVRGFALQEVWAALRASERAVLESVTLADLAAGTLPEGISTRTG